LQTYVNLKNKSIINFNLIFIKMKKGLLTLLAAALTIVGCQDYDSQFKELTTLVTNLAADVQGLKELSTEIDTLSATVDGLSSSLDVASIQATLDELEAALVGVADETDLTTLAEALAAVQEDVRELLAANAVINQSITISNEATLQYAESLVGTGTDDPTVIVNGSVTVNSTFANADASLTSRINAITNKIATILGVEGGAGLILTHSASSTINFNELAFVDKTVEITGETYGHPKLTTITGNVTETHSGAIDYPLLASAANFVIGNDVTSVNFPSTANLSAVSSKGSATGELWLKEATSINTGKAVITILTAPKATSITMGAGAAHDAALTIVTGVNAAIVHSATSITGNLAVTGGASQTTLDASALTFVGGTTTIGDYASANLGAVTQFGNATTIGAAAITLTALSKNASGTLTFTRATVVDTQALAVTSNVTYTIATQAHFLTGSNANINLPLVETLELFEQGVTTNFDTSGYATLKNFYITGAQGKAPFITTTTNVVTATGAALVSVQIKGGDIDTVLIDSAAALTSLTTAGEIRDFVINDCDALVSATIDHDHISGSDASDLTITGNLKLASFAPSDLKFLGNITITGNAALASLDFTSMTKIPLAGAYNVTIGPNKLVGSFTAPSAGSTTTDAIEAVVKNNSLYTMVGMAQLAIDSRANTVASDNVTYTFDVDLSDVDATAAVQTLDAAIGAAVVPADSNLVVGIGADTDYVTIVQAED
jgi:hypothetical protein